MGEARARAKIEGYLTRREQITLGTIAIGFGRPGQGEQGKAGGRDLRQRKEEALEQLGVAWVGDQISERQGNPDFSGKPMWDPEQRTSEAVRFTIDKDLLAWVREELDKVPVGGLDDRALSVIEARFTEMAAGDFKMPAELLDAPPAIGNGVAAAVQNV